MNNTDIDLLEKEADAIKKSLDERHKAFLEQLNVSEHELHYMLNDPEKYPKELRDETKELEDELDRRIEEKAQDKVERKSARRNLSFLRNIHNQV